MTKTQKELAFLRELHVDSAWTERFTDFVDKNLKLSDAKNILYINAGTGNHAIALREKLDKDSKIFAVSENQDLLNIARDKAAAVKADVNFSTRKFKDKTFDAVLVDASFSRPADLRNLLNEAARVAETGGKVALFTPTAGSFGEIFSFLWEIFFNDGLGNYGAEAESLITGLPTVSRLEEIAENAGLKKIETQTSNETFEYENGAEFINSTLVANFLLPVWLKFLNKKQKERVHAELVQLVDAEDGDLSFRFSVKATLMTGEKG
ncbi:MAG: class I SAM-dependent methyltransferase [Pyrinomonadaceae bacterium]